MKKTLLSVLTSGVALASLSAAQQNRYEHPVRQAVRGVHGAVAAGSEYATEAGSDRFRQDHAAPGW